MRIRKEVTPFILSVLAVYALVSSILREWIISGFVAAVGAGYFMYFFRDPERVTPDDESAVFAGADGIVSSVKTVYEDTHLKTSCVRISIFLSLFDVHVNHAPISGKSEFLGYFPGKRFFTFCEKSSDMNQHNKILITGRRTRCLVCQIVGPVCRRVVYWPPHDVPVEIPAGARIGMMKFGSRLDMYLPESDVIVVAKKGDAVRAGETIVARINAQPTDGDEANCPSLRTGLAHDRIIPTK